jgi:hypothetical protein
MKNSIFKANPKLDCYFETSDGTPFYTDYAANTHAKSLDNKSVKTVHRSDAVEPTTPIEEKKEATQPVEPIAPVQEKKEATQPVELTTPIEEKKEVTEPVEPIAPVEEKKEATEPVEPATLFAEQKEPKEKNKK